MTESLIRKKVLSLCHLGEDALAAGNYDHAHHCFSEALTIDPHNKTALNGKVQALMRWGDTAIEAREFDKAHHYYSMALEASPDNKQIQRRKEEALQLLAKGEVGDISERSSILFLAADPTDASRLRLGEEFREIQEKLKLARLRDDFKLELPQLSVRPPDISQAMLDIEPQIVHFSGHGTPKGALCFEDQVGQTLPIQPDAIAALFEQFANQVNCVVLNACYSEIQANAIVKHIDYVIGMNQAIGDKAAIAFAIGFYQALGAGRTIEDAYKLGCVQIQLQGIPEHLTPVLLKRKSHPTEPQRVTLEITPIERLENDCPHISVVVRNRGSRTIFCKVESHGIYDSSGKDIKRSVSTYANHFSWAGGSDKGTKEIPANLDNVINLVKVNKRGYGIAFLFDENPYSHWKTEGTYRLDLKIIGRFEEDSLEMEPISQVVRVELEYIESETQSNTGQVINNSELKLLNWRLVEDD
jgi:tetratricopeptide (TPR) repeat protein